MQDFIGPRLPLDIPLFLIIPQEERKKSWVGRKLTDPYRGGNEENWRIKEAERRAAIEAEKKAKNAAALARLKEQHAGEKYDRKLKMWVKDNALES